MKKSKLKQTAMEVTVGTFILMMLLLLGFFTIVLSRENIFVKNYQFEVLFDNVTGLITGDKVYVQGVDVGRVKSMTISEQGVNVVLSLKYKPVFRQDYNISVESSSILGGKFVAVSEGSDTVELLGDGVPLHGKAPVDFVAEMTETIKSVRGSLEEGGILGNLSVTMTNVADISTRIKNGEGTLGKLVNDEELYNEFKDVAASLKEITAKIENGEGTIGKLVNSPEAHDQLMSALGSVEKGVDALGSTLNRVNELKLELGLDGAYLSELEDSRSAFRLDLLPHGAESPRYYRVELVSDPRGRISEKREVVTVTRPDGSTATTTTDRLTSETRRNNWSALFGFPFADRRGSLWAGILENTAGVQVDYKFFRQRAMLSFEAFDFGRERDLDPHLRLTGQWNFYRNLYVKAGYDDPLVDEFRSPFLGIGIHWSDDDLKYLMGSVPKL